MGPRNASINKGKNIHKTNVLQNIANRNNAKTPQRLLVWTLTKGVSDKHLSGLLSHLWLGSHQQPPRNFALFLKLSPKTTTLLFSGGHFKDRTVSCSFRIEVKDFLRQPTGQWIVKCMIFWHTCKRVKIGLRETVLSRVCRNCVNFQREVVCNHLCWTILPSLEWADLF